jgi:hypothetical protein
VSTTVRWQGPHGWRFGKYVKEDKTYVYVRLGESDRLTRVKKELVKSWPGERKK